MDKEYLLPSEIPEDFICKHFQPSYWEGRGYKRNWGDAAVMMWPRMEILRGTFEEPWGLGGTLEKITRFVILAPLIGMRRPVVIETKADLPAKFTDREYRRVITQLLKALLGGSF